MNQIREFEKFIKRRKPEHIFYQTELQRWSDIENPCVLRLDLPQVSVSEHPGVIYLSDGKNSLRLERVYRIEYDNNAMPLCTVITVYCSLRPNETKEYVYRLIAS